MNLHYESAFFNGFCTVRVQFDRQLVTANSDSGFH
jgi:hypothetical protein